MWIFCVCILFADTSSYYSACTGSKLQLTSFNLALPLGMTSCFYFNKARGIYISQHSVNLPLGHYEIHPSTCCLVIYQGYGTTANASDHSLWVTGLKGTAPWRKGRLLHFVPYFALYPLASPAGGWQ